MGKLILYSLVGHIIILSLVFALPVVSDKQNKPKNIYRVSFVELPGNPAQKNIKSTNHKEKEASKPQPKKEKETPKPEKTAVKKPPVAPIPEKQKVEKEPEKKPQPDKTAEVNESVDWREQRKPKSAKKIKERTEKQTQFSTTTTASLGPRGVGSLSLEDVDFPYSYYLSIMQRRIAQNWDPVYGEFEEKGAQRVVIYFRIQRDGSIKGLKIEKSSGNETLDRSATMAIMKSGPLPPLPHEFEGEELRVHFGFEYSREG